MSDPDLPPLPRKRRGCFFYICLCFACFALLALLFVVFTTLWVRKQLYAYTDSAPVKLPLVETSDSEFLTLQERLKSFGDAVQRGKPAPPLVLTEHDINVLIAKSPGLSWAAGKVYAGVNGNQIKGSVSFLMPSYIRLAQGRYFNGDATFLVSLENGRLIVKPDDIEVKGKQIPPVFMNKLRDVNLAEEFDQDPQNAQTLTNLESIAVQDGQLVIKPR